MNFSDIGTNNKWLCSGSSLSEINDFEVTNHEEYMIHYTLTKNKVLEINEELGTLDRRIERLETVIQSLATAIQAEDYIKKVEGLNNNLEAARNNIYNNILSIFVSVVNRLNEAAKTDEWFSNMAKRYSEEIMETVLDGKVSTGKQDGTYTVASGDTLGAIATANGIALEDLIAANPQISDPNLIYTGDQITIPGTGEDTITANLRETPDYVKVRAVGENNAVEDAIDWAINTANDDSHGYSQYNRWGDSDYDCSSFVISAYENAGVDVSDATYTGNMKDVFTANGFEWIPGTPDVNSLQPGDILLNEGNHTEMYIGNGQNVGAHIDEYGGIAGTNGGDQTGTEISVTDYWDDAWDGVLRYTGD